MVELDPLEALELRLLDAQRRLAEHNLQGATSAVQQLAARFAAAAGVDLSEGSRWVIRPDAGLIEEEGSK